jgi:NAD(P)-dependent dehydrogenase (short-subunit alcohol dehydrogenase family)
MAERLAGKVALITGASSGIGAATARLFAAEGAELALLARRPGPLAELASELGNGTLTLPADVADSDQVAAAVARAAERFGRLDVVVNCAGTLVPGRVEETNDEDWHRQIEVNLSGSFFVARAAAPRIAPGGSIVNLGSELSVMGMGMYVGYCASKAGVIGLTRALAAELAPDVRVNAICPGPVDTPMLTAELESFGPYEELHAETVERVPLGRLATAEEVAAGILYLAAEAGYATGTTLELDGGTTSV